ncbi:glutamate--tRNA ligase [Pseudaquidulcibacter saccharophilus]|uniref:glutamate--tRNA ligase n=1 Tax=Pseudaquidulcibacter saccharophilus TaxID=2831900 RepID=UPI001EFF4DDF|nr:glutamate--tRNA ligase [Pseudaquidulcibacter saccharophilus]
MKVRFAPSPTGKLHVGNIRVALMNYLYCKINKGHFLLRIDDTDFVRSTKEFENGIYADLEWLGIKWDSLEHQSKRGEIYDKARDDLIAKGLLYPCYETAEELDKKRKIQTSLGKPPIYDRAALQLTAEEKTKLEAEGRKAHWRFKLSGNRVLWNDLVRGEQTVDTSSMSDPVLIREDGAYLYTLPSVVDDVELGISHVIRGEDHVTNTGAQIEIFEALSGTRPEFGHFPLLVGKDGEGLSKRLGSLSIESMRGDGVEPMAILSLLAKLGTSDAVEAVLSIDDLIGTFDFAKIGRAPARFNPEDVTRLNSQLLHITEYDAVKSHLAELGCDLGVDFWNIIRGNLHKISDAKIWAQVISGEIEPVIEDAEFANAAAALVPDDIKSDTWSGFVASVKEKTGKTGKNLFMPLRLALTGQAHGPDMSQIFALIGSDKAKKRLSGNKA